MRGCSDGECGTPGNSQAGRGRGYKNLRYLLLKALRMAFTKIEFVVFRKAA